MDQLKEKIKLLQETSKEESNYAKVIRRKANFALDLVYLFVKYDLIDWELEMVKEVGETVNACDNVISAAERVETLESPFLPWGELDTERLKSVRDASSNMLKATESLRTSIENNSLMLNTYDSVKEFVENL